MGFGVAASPAVRAAPLAALAAPPRPLRPALRRTAVRAGGDVDGANITKVEKADDEPWPVWTFQQLISLISGFIGSILSLNAYSQLREATKRRDAIVRQSQARKQERPTIINSKSARIVQQLGGSLLDAEAESPLFSLGPVPVCTLASNLRLDRHITIITTAALPWRTGTAVNPLLRALYLAKAGKPVILYLPFLEKPDQPNVFAKGVTFDTPEQQEEVVREWCSERAKMDLKKMDLQFRWYPARQAMGHGLGPCCRDLDNHDQDLVVS